MRHPETFPARLAVLALATMVSSCALPTPGSQGLSLQSQVNSPQMRKVDAVISGAHRAAVGQNPNNGVMLVQVDRAALIFGPIDSFNGRPFIPERIVNVIDLPQEIAVIVQGRNLGCGLRYSITSFMPNGGSGLYIGRCGRNYTFRQSGSYILATEAGTSSPEVIRYALASAAVISGQSVGIGSSPQRASSAPVGSSDQRPHLQEPHAAPAQPMQKLEPTSQPPGPLILEL